MTNAEAWFNKSLRPRKPEGSLGRTAQDVHLDSHTAPELWERLERVRTSTYIAQSIVGTSHIRTLSRESEHFTKLDWLSAWLCCSSCQVSLIEGTRRKNYQWGRRTSCRDSTRVGAGMSLTWCSSVPPSSRGYLCARKSPYPPLNPVSVSLRSFPNVAAFETVTINLFDY